MTRRCKCEHWQDCPTCAPQRFDADGKRKPPEPTPLQACRAELETMREALALHEVGSAYAHRLAVMLECALLDPTGTWNEAHALLDEYRAACRAAAPMQEPPTFMGEPVVMPNACIAMQIAHRGAASRGNFDAVCISLLRYLHRNGIDASASMFLKPPGSQRQQAQGDKPLMNQ